MYIWCASVILAAHLQQSLALVFCLPFQGDLVLKEINHLRPSSSQTFVFSSTPHVIKYPADYRKITFWYRLDAISYFWSCKDNSKYSESPEDTFAQRLQRGKEWRIRYTLKCFVPFSLKIRACSNFCSASSWCSTLETVPILIQWSASGFRITCQLSLAFSNLTSVNS